jgi:UDP-glucose:(heptosyl)LPS alpha-1,3-glucosyltransferase
VRVALIADRLRTSGGGLERYLGDLRAFLEAQGDEVALIAGAPSAIPRGARERAFARRVERVLRQGRFDASLAVRHVGRAHVYEPHGGSVAAGLAAREEVARTPRLARLLHRMVPKFRAFRILERQALDRSRLVVAVSPLVAKDLRALAPRAPLREVPLGVDLARFSPSGPRADLRARRGLPRTGAALLFVGHDFDLKGLPAALRVLARLAAQGRSASLAVAGSGSPRAMRGLAGALGVEDRVQFLGAVRDPAPLYRGSDLLLQPTRYDPCSLATLEALACGLPVVTTSRNGAAEGHPRGFRRVEDPDDEGAIAREALALLEEGASAREAARASVEGRDAARRSAEMRGILREVAGPLER